MRLPRSPLLLPALGATLVLGACSFDTDPGPQVAQDRAVGSFTRVDTRGAVDVRLRAGEPKSLQVRAGRDVIDDVRTEVRYGTLRIWLDGDHVHAGRTVVDVGAPEIEAIDSDGASDIAAGGLHGGTLAVHTDGAGDLTANGSVDHLAVDVSGAGDLHLADLEAGDARVRLSGAANAEIRANARLHAEVSGAGSLRYFGDPELSQQVSGAASVSRGD